MPVKLQRAGILLKNIDYNVYRDDEGIPFIVLGDQIALFFSELNDVEEFITIIEDLQIALDSASSETEPDSEVSPAITVEGDISEDEYKTSSNEDILSLVKEISDFKKETIH